MSRWSTIFWSFSALGGLYAIFIALLLNESLQRHALYAHRFHTARWHNISRPESFGFAEGQVVPFRITTHDDESLYAWHVLPMGLYAQELRSLRDGHKGELSADRFQDSRAFELLRDPKSRLVINFHGNAGHVAQGWRTAAYKSFSTADSARIHVLTFDYRGFGTSTGSPTEDGLIIDGIAMVNWALNTAKIPPHRILLVGHSLGTAVATAVAAHFAVADPDLHFAGLLLCSGFSDIPNLLKTYMIGGVVPVLSPLQGYPRLQRLFSERIADVWNTTARLQRLAALSPQLRLQILHARNDFDINWRHAELLFEAVAAGLQLNPNCGGTDLTSQETDSTEIWTRRAVLCRGRDAGKGKAVVGYERASRTILYDGGHNRVLTHYHVAIAIRDLFDQAKKHV